MERVEKVLDSKPTAFVSNFLPPLGLLLLPRTFADSLMKVFGLPRPVNLTIGTPSLWLKALIDIDLRYEGHEFRRILRDCLCGVVGTPCY